VFHLQSIILSENGCGENAEAAKSRNFFSKFFGRFLTLYVIVTHFRVAHAKHQAVTIKAGVCCPHMCAISAF
jgi:hypothetical protein